jgi:uracil-DNA glycosylase family 4
MERVVELEKALPDQGRMFEELLDLIGAVKGQVAFHQWLGLRGISEERLYEPSMSASKMLQRIRDELGACRRCRLSEKRTHLVFGQGNPDADLVFIGEAPGQEEDEAGVPFVGAAGKILTDIIVKGMKLSREDVYISNVVKCRPPGNRDPLPEEIRTCEPFLKRQLEAIRPRVIVALGKFAAQTLLKTDTPISRLRGNFHDYEGIPLMPTFHPGYLLRNPGGKKLVWEDIKKVIHLLEKK